MRTCILLAGSALALVTAGTAWAQSAPQVDEVVVTARKQSENLIDVPDTVQAFSADQLQRAGVGSVNDLSRMTPNLVLVEAQQPGVVLINIRGVGQVRNGEAPVAVVVDGVQQNSPNQITQDLFDIERIEVLKGPQGALYGRNAIGGAINIVTRAPGQELEGSVTGGYAEGQEYTARAEISAPIAGDDLSFRLAGSYTHRDGQIDNQFLGQKVDFNEAKALRGVLVAKPSERLKLDLRASYFEQDAGASYYVPEPVPNHPTDPVANILGQGGRRLTDLSLKADYDLGPATLTSITGYSIVKSSLFEDLDWLPADLLAASQDLDTHAFSEEVRLSSRPGAGPVSWLAGAYYLHTDRKLDTTIYLQPGLSGLPAPLVLGATRSTDHNDAYAAFGQAIYDISPAWQLTGALRYDVDDRHEIDRNPPAGGPTDFNASFHSLQPKVSLAFKPTDHDNLYVTVAKGFRSGGFNANAAVTRSFKQEELWNYELGYKGSWFANRLFLDSSLFYERITNRQVFGLDLTTAPDQFIANPIPKSHVLGGELLVTGRPTPNLDIELGGGVTTSRIDSYDPSVFAGTLARGDFSGNQLPQTPAYTLNAAVQYRWDLAGGDSLSLRAEESGSGAFYWEVDNKNRREAVFLTNVRLAYEHGPASITLYVKNLFDRRYDVEYVGVEFSAAISGNLGLISPPRQVGLTARLKF